MSNNRTIALNYNLNEDLIITKEDALTCMVLCKKNNELKAFDYLDDYLKNHYQLQIKPRTKQTSANALICLLARTNEPKTLREIADQSIAAGYDLNQQYKGGGSAIQLAAQYDSTEAMKVLLEPKYNIKLDLPNCIGGTAVSIAASAKHIGIVKLLAKAGANLKVPQIDGRTPIHIAAENDDAALMNLLLEYKVDINQPAESKNFPRTAAHFAAEENSVKITEILLARGGAFNKPDEKGALPIHLCL